MSCSLPVHDSRQSGPKYRWRSRTSPGKKTIQTSLVGPITLDCDGLTTPGSDLRVVVYRAEPETPVHDRLDELRVAGLQAFSSTAS
jgi:hypothetical protein